MRVAVEDQEPKSRTRNMISSLRTCCRARSTTKDTRAKTGIGRLEVQVPGSHGGPSQDSVQHAKQGEIARALKTDAARKRMLEPMTTPTDVARSGRRTRRWARWMDTAHAQGCLFYLGHARLRGHVLHAQRSFCMRGYAAMFRRASSLDKSNLLAGPRRLCLGSAPRALLRSVAGALLAAAGEAWTITMQWPKRRA